MSNPKAEENVMLDADWRKYAVKLLFSNAQQANKFPNLETPGARYRGSYQMLVMLVGRQMADEIANEVDTMCLSQGLTPESRH